MGLWSWDTVAVAAVGMDMDMGMVACCGRDGGREDGNKEETKGSKGSELRMNLRGQTPKKKSPWCKCKCTCRSGEVRGRRNFPSTIVS